MGSAAARLDGSGLPPCVHQRLGDMPPVPCGRRCHIFDRAPDRTSAAHPADARLGCFFFDVNMDSSMICWWSTSASHRPSRDRCAGGRRGRHAALFLNVNARFTVWRARRETFRQAEDGPLAPSPTSTRRLTLEAVVRPTAAVSLYRTDAPAALAACACTGAPASRPEGRTRRFAPATVRVARALVARRRTGSISCLSRAA